MPIKQRFDRLLLGAAVLQTAMGLAVLASASWLIATERYGRSGSYFFTWQAATAMIGLGVMIVCMHLRTELTTDRRLAVFALGISWVLLAVAFLQAPVASTHRWLSVGGISLQPSVLARLALIMFAAVVLDDLRREGWPQRRLLVFAAICAITTGLIVAEPDLGSAALLIVVLGVMTFVSGMPMRFFAAPVAVASVVLAVAIVGSPYRLARMQAFFDSQAGAAAGWQSYQSLVAIGSGGIVGRGYGAGLQKLFFLPEPHTDFIFSMIGEELGLVGLLTFLGLAGVITWRGLVIAGRQEGSRRGLLAFGLTAAFAVQSLIHMLVCLDLLPPKGIPLPLVSYGKTDLVITLVAIGLLLNLSREVTA
ncbi:MAG: FtsW/RodA/SpoVE family cell cycle protein [Thermoanaerobaculales bacterium]